MSPTELEHRLTSALAARAEQITAADLRPPAPPTGPRPPRHGWILATVTLAAALLSVAVFVLIGQVRDAPIAPSHQPSPTTTATSEAPPMPATPAASPTREPETTASTAIEATPNGRRPSDSGVRPRVSEAAPDPSRTAPQPAESTKPPTTRPADPAVVGPTPSAGTTP